MRLLDRFLKPAQVAAQAAEQAQSMAFVANPQRNFSKVEGKRRGLRKGMWVKLPYQGVGILTELHLGGIAVVMLTDDAGLNRAQVLVNLDEPVENAPALRQARFDEIPIPRRPEYDAAAAMGY